jgi:antitoxin YefM
MTIQTSYSQARATLAKLLDEVTHNREVVIIRRRGEEDVALVSAQELTALLETAYLLRSPKNAERLLGALGRALKEDGTPATMEHLRQEVGLESQEP